MKYNIIITIVATSLVAGISFAEKSEIEESKDFAIRASLGITPGIDEAEGSGGTGDIGGDAGGRAEVLVVKRWWGKNNPNIGGSVGGGIFLGNKSISELGDTVDLTTFGLLLQGGFIAKAGDNIVLEVGPYLGLGVANNETTGYTSANGTYAFFGVKGGAFVLLGDNIELGLELGYESFTHKQEYIGGWLDGEITFSGSGAHVGAVLAVKF